MWNYIRKWFERQFSDPQVIILTLMLLFLTAMVLLLARMMVPVLASVIIAYLLEGQIRNLARIGVPRRFAVLGVFSVFMVFFFLLLFGLLPMLSRQVAQLLTDLPSIIAEGQRLLMRLPAHYPSIFSESQVQELIGGIRSEVGRLGQQALSLSLAFIPGLITLVVYLILVPLLVFFFLKDKTRLVDWFAGYVPPERQLAVGVWRDVDQQIGNYIRGKFWEILIVGSVSYVVFLLLGLNFAILMGAIVGLSVLIPYIGATVVTFPLALLGYAQWGWGNEFIYLMIAYAIIQALDANVLVPILFSEIVNLHPTAIIVAILFFGGIWGFWGIFFAIPLATVVKAVLDAWPRQGKSPAPPDENQAVASGE